MIHRIVESSLRFRPLVIAVAAIVMLLGVTRFADMPKDVFPEILPVTVTVQTEALGLSAYEVEQLITVPIEADLLAGTPWLDAMRSESVPGLSSIDLTFKRGTDPWHARQVVQERLTQAHALPNVSKPPQMLQPLSSTNRIMLIGLSSKTQSLIDMSVLARWTIRPRLMGVPGVANVAIWGQRERQLQVQVDPARLQANGISLNQIIRTTGNALWYSPLTFLEASVAGTGGFIETPNQRLGIRHILPITVAADLAKIAVEGTNKRLGDVATVVEDHQPLIGDAIRDSGPGLLLVVEKLPGVNTLEVTEGIMTALAALKPGLGGIEFDTSVYQPADYIRKSISNVAGALLIALILVAVALLAFTRSWRAALIGLVAIPVSLTAALVVIYLAGATINAMIVAGLVIALGVIVDDAIVDNHRFRQRLAEGSGSPAQMLLAAWSDMRGPLFFATMVVLLAALPALFLTASFGAFVKPMVLAYAVAVLVSLAVAATLTPALSLGLLGSTAVDRRDSPLDPLTSRVIAAPRAVIAVAVIATMVGLVLLPQLNVKPAPDFKESDLLVHWDMMPGTSRSEMNRILDRVSLELRSVPGVRNVAGHVGRAILSDQVVGIHSSELWVSLDPQAPYEATVSAVEEVIRGYPGVDADVLTYLRSRFTETLSGVDEPVVVRLYGQQLDVLREEAEKVKASMTAIDGIVDARIEVEFEEPVLEVEVDLKAAQAYGVKPGDVRRAAATLIAGLNVGNLFEEQKIFEVVVWGEPQIRRDIAGVSDLMINRPQGGQVRLSDVASVQMVPAPMVIRRENVARCVDVVANVNGGDLGAITAAVQNRLEDMTFPLEYRAEMLGDFAAQQESRNRVIWISIAAVIGILLVFQAAFGSWPLAFAVLLTLPIALAGSFIAASATGAALSLASFAGVLTVLGVTARNSILLLNRYRALRRESGMAFGPELVLKGIRDRAGAIVTAAIVTAAAVLPLALFGTRPGHEILGPLAVVIIGGLVTATLYMLAVVPALYSRFGAGVSNDTIDDEDLTAAVTN